MQFVLILTHADNSVMHYGPFSNREAAWDYWDATLSPRLKIGWNASVKWLELVHT